MHSLAAGGQVPGIHCRPAWRGNRPRKGMSYRGLGHPRGFDRASGFLWADRVLQTIYSRLCEGSTAVKSAYRKGGDLAVDSHRTESVRVPQGPPNGGPHLGLPRPKSGVHPRHGRQ